MSRKTLIKTRVSDKLYLFEKAEDLNEEQRQLLPTYEEIIKCFKSFRLHLKGDGSKEPASNEIANIVTQKVSVIWQRASLPTVSHKRIVDMILTYNKSLTCTETHYCRSRTMARRYLPCELNIRKLHKRYNELVDEHLRVKECFFRNNVNINYNIDFGTPLTNMCLECLKPKEKLKTEANQNLGN
ncbi:unnamed protein product [Psylliodes chrysocephalus]|uniref:Uncharacterized protein n=1 Tax=Psylliodes chrysocephalus TaxID=3402493 RepID=A0A9P0CLI9_9CUCU|nr:unnamed protein product [Psylliodes chrysocephala]